MAFKYAECGDCYFHNRHPEVCDDCEDGDQWEPEDEDEDSLEAKAQAVVLLHDIFYKEAA
jgi:hypothetical protein